MMFGSFFRSWRTLWSGNATADTTGIQQTSPNGSLVPNTQPVSEDAALQLATLWACIELRANIIASLPFFVYEQKDGMRELARKSSLYQLLHESPNSRMTPFEFWRAVMFSLELRGAAYVRLDRRANGEVFAMWPMSYDQTTQVVMDDGRIAYEYRVANNVAVLAEQSVMHIKGLGNGTSGLDKLSFMRATTAEARAAQEQATTLFSAGGRISGVLMIDKLLTKEQREQIKTAFGKMESGSTTSLHVLEAGMKYQQVGLKPEDQQLLETRRMVAEDICAFMGVPPVLVHRAGATTWGSGIYEIKDGFYTLALRPQTINIEQAVRKSVMTPHQRATQTAEMSFDALLRGDPDKRSQIIARQVQNGLKTRNEARQLENDPPIDGGDVITVQSNLLPIKLLGNQVSSGGDGSTLAQ